MLRRLCFFQMLGIAVLSGCNTTSTITTSTYSLAEQYRTGNGKILSPPLAFDNYKKDAAQGNPKSISRLSWCYQFGFGTDRNLSKAFECLDKARDTQDAQLLRQLANMYRMGIGCDQDYTESLRLYTLAYEAGDGESIVQIADHYALGLGVDKDDTQATRLLEEAGKSGNRYAKIRLLTKEFDQLTERKLTSDSKVKIKQLAANLLQLNKQDFYVMLHFPGSYFIAGIWGFDDSIKDGPSDYETIKKLIHEKVPEAFSVADTFTNENERFKIMLEGAKAGLPDCMAYVGNALLHGYGVSADIPQARKWLETAAKRNQPSAVSNLGWMYHVGKMGMVDYGAAVKLYSRAIDLGDETANYYLGYCYDYGNGVPKDRRRAIDLYRTAAAKENVQAKEALQRLGVK
jgi:TPR repeat protein